MFKPLNEIGIADERPSKGDQVGKAILDRFFSRLLGVAAVTDQWPMKYLTELAESHWITQFMEAKAQSVYHMQVRQAATIEVCGNKCELLTKVG